ncbi:DUF2634 domain-containing protein [Lederbergia wuyishanensis]|uniref:DUF2634 domain-containing protein n=1 Tax=Lederbergia wuyishanensis TaxID=1347903 RepID=A0ABU0D781_9BACI|nr:DUF2634 domain-containing protein [Lederbergia wuyishanensis]MCJ8008893.1 DUF2634 domain-containing protein [Lederbergia wuyishanensis]MDQ0344218.1 hypothetical protein [Lederbergia wuyishanensis]
MVLPTGEIVIDDEIDIIDDEELPTKTYYLDFEKGQCLGTVDGLKAMEQSIYKILNTIRFEHLIYSDDYGFEPIFGQERIFVQMDLPRRIEEALLQDERIASIEDMSLDFKGDTVYVEFTAITNYGDVAVLREVSNVV